jgi:hypothetical protein
MEVWVIIGSVSSAALLAIGIVQLWLAFKDGKPKNRSSRKQNNQNHTS